ncbi:hypothetical protein TVAG_122750 [Trichomonas vaginalis G3]|uniref:Uncharacterized protein n=1 Tax=Trichomonas vaginalis (strain ATCC PRA-98 / G3) TaxID=412133 RepID=A2DN32_TRIV3|nr:phospholipase C/P1 nuclease family [Trichomonas vaginalis G3]EAY18209.1 hypothetical protein TVAG_122750 [Trichomonas vaginalis G3]KAI5491511.1 phospholipase C/P1 nuclease family [Trichomonas vaginalis G3]|eukprot:XP_001579195.1 hypothetical protein [Trichomonas vaginalis G3]
MFFVLLFLSRSWSEEYLTIGMEVMFHILGDTGPQLVQKVLDLTDEKLERPSLAGSWLVALKRPPSNTDCFDHWRYSQRNFTSIVNMSDYHANSDDLSSTLNSLNKSIVGQTLDGPWPYNFGMKTFFTLYLEAFAPIHVTEYFDDGKFLHGDDNGKKFYIKYKGENMSLHDFWDTGCGRYMLESPYSAENWKSIDSLVTKLYKRMEDATITAPLPANYAEAIEQSFNYSISTVYNMDLIVPDKELPDEYVNTCIETTDKRMLQAASSLSKFLKYYSVPIIKKNPPVQMISPSEAVAWGLLFFVAPLTIYLVWKLIHNKIKSE